MLTDFHIYLTVWIRRTCNNTVTKDPTVPRVYRYTTVCNVSVLKATIENKTTSVTTHFRSASSSSKADTLNTWCKNCRMRQLLYIITETINTLFLVVIFLMCCYRSRLVFSCCFQDAKQRSVAKHLRCDVIFSDSIITNFLLIQTVTQVWKSVNIWWS